jgi:hypothetical protein
MNRKLSKKVKGDLLIPIEIYGSFLVVSVNQSRKEINSSYNVNVSKDQYIEKDSLARTIKTHQGSTLLMIKYLKGQDKAKLAGTIAHECFHCAMFILDRAGLTVNWNSDEAYAYLISFLTEKITKFISDLENNLHK